MVTWTLLLSWSDTILALNPNKSLSKVIFTYIYRMLKKISQTDLVVLDIKDRRTSCQARLLSIQGSDHIYPPKEVEIVILFYQLPWTSANFRGDLPINFRLPPLALLR